MANISHNQVRTPLLTPVTRTATVAGSEAGQADAGVSALATGDRKLFKQNPLQALHQAARASLGALPWESR